MRIIFFGTPSFAVPSLKKLVESGMQVVAVVTQPDKLKGRGHQLAEPPVKEYAKTLGIPVLQPLKIRTPEFLAELAAFSPDAAAVVAYGRILPQQILKLPPLGCINVHGSLLPKYRGAAPIQWSLINGDLKTGITTMLMDEGLDTGDILLVDETPISDEDTAVSLGVRLSEMGAALLLSTLKGLLDKKITPVPQQGEPSFAPPLKKEDGRIAWSWSANRICNLIRGTSPWPGAFSSINRERLVILRALAVGSSNSSPAGTICSLEEHAIHVSTAEGVVKILELRPDGKKAMPARDFANGRRLKEGMCFDAA